MPQRQFRSMKIPFLIVNCIRSDMHLWKNREMPENRRLRKIRSKSNIFLGKTAVKICVLICAAVFAAVINFKSCDHFMGWCVMIGERPFRKKVSAALDRH